KPEGTWALPKGLIDDGEKAAATAVREVAEETGVEGRVVEKLGDVRYVYTWAGERVFKVVSFFLLRAGRGRIGNLPPEHAHEVAEVTTATTVLGTEVSMPLLIAPVAYQRMLDPEGERATARATEAAGTIMCLSTISTFSAAEVAAAAPGLQRWFQLYVFKDWA